MKVELRSYRREDFEKLYRIDQSCYEPGIAYSRGTLREFLELEGTRCLVATREGQIIGFLIAIHEAAFGHLITIDVVRSARRAGVGSALLHQVENELTEAGVERITLETATDNHAAIAFWEKHGYRRVAIYPRYYLDQIDAYLMAKRLEADRRRSSFGRGGSK